MVTPHEATRPLPIPEPRAWWWPWLLGVVLLAGTAGWCLLIITVLTVTGCY